MEGSRPPGVSPDPLSFAAVAMDLGNDALGPPPPLPPAEAAFVSMLPTGLDQQGPWFDFPPLPQLQQTDGGLGQQLNVGLGCWAADGGGGYGRASGPAHAKEPDAATMAAKLAAAREKNRLAQQRFRERQRAKQKQAGEQCEEMQREMDQVRPCGGALADARLHACCAAGPKIAGRAAALLPHIWHMLHMAHAAPPPERVPIPLQVESENAELQAQNRIYQKVLAVRDAMLQTFASLKQPESTDGPAPAPTEVAELPEPAPAAAAALAKALRELPSEVEMAAAEAAVEAVEAAVQQAEQQEQDPPSPGWTLGEAHRSGTAAQLDGSELRQVASIPAVNDTRIQATVDAMTEPEHLVRGRGGGGCASGQGVGRRGAGPRAFCIVPCLPMLTHARSAPPPCPQLDYYRQWQAELSVAYVAAEAAGFDAAGIAELTALQGRMAKVRPPVLPRDLPPYLTPETAPGCCCCCQLQPLPVPCCRALHSSARRCGGMRRSAVLHTCASWPMPRCLRTRRSARCGATLPPRCCHNSWSRSAQSWWVGGRGGQAGRQPGGRAAGTHPELASFICHRFKERWQRLPIGCHPTALRHPSAPLPAAPGMVQLQPQPG